MAGIRTIFLIRRGTVSWERQYAACHDYVERHGYEIVATARKDDDVISLLRAHLAEVVVAAYDLAGDGRLRGLIAHAGGRLEYCRPQRHHPPPPAEPEPEAEQLGHDTGEIVRRMARRGGTVDEIVRLLGVPIERVTQILRQKR